MDPILARVNGAHCCQEEEASNLTNSQLAAHRQRESVRMISEGHSLQAVTHHCHVAYSTIVLALERIR
jgi:hypothetical protein